MCELLVYGAIAPTKLPKKKEKKRKKEKEGQKRRKRRRKETPKYVERKKCMPRREIEGKFLSIERWPHKINSLSPTSGRATLFQPLGDGQICHFRIKRTGLKAHGVECM